MKDLIAIDVETGGLDPQRHALLSIAVVPSWQYEPFHVCIQPGPGTRVDDEAAKVNGYTPERWEQHNAVLESQALEMLVQWLKESGALQKKAGAVAHNAAFDRGFLDMAQNVHRRDLGINRRWRCSMVAMMAAQDAGLLPEGKCTLDALGEATGFWLKEPRAEAHDALQDARACLHGYTWLINAMTKQPELTLFPCQNITL